MPSLPLCASITSAAFPLVGQPNELLTGLRMGLIISHELRLEYLVTGTLKLPFKVSIRQTH